MNALKQLEHQAIAAFRDGRSWNQFYSEHVDAIKQCEPYSRQRFKRLYDRLLSLVVSGDDYGVMSLDDAQEPWLADDASTQPDDTRTSARLLDTP